eukprot:6223937-Pyramimonas_sp.AAC.1
MGVHWSGCGYAMRTLRWGLRWSSPRGHEACEGGAGSDAAAPCGPCRWGLRWSSLRGRELSEGCTESGA